MKVAGAARRSHAPNPAVGHPHPAIAGRGVITKSLRHYTSPRVSGEKVPKADEGKFTPNAHPARLPGGRIGELSARRNIASYRHLHENRCEEKPMKITVQKNGPLRIEGEDILIQDPEQQAYGLAGRNVVSLCRCGHSNNKPFCDGS